MSETIKIKHIIENVLSGNRLSVNDAVYLFRKADLFTLGDASYEFKTNIHKEKVYWRKDININPTNICVSRCGFCSFRKNKSDKEAYMLTVEEVLNKVIKSKKMGINEIHVVGGLNRDCDLNYFRELFAGIKKIDSALFIQALTAVEMNFISKVSKIDLKDTIKILKSSGLDLMPGGGSEIFNGTIRNLMMATKIGKDAWINVHKIAHESGLLTNATMLYGHVETDLSVIEHMNIIRNAQDMHPGFLAFVPLSYNIKNNILSKRYDLKGSSGLYDLRIVALSRLFFDNIKHIKLPWVSISKEVASVSLSFGVDDIGGTAYEERIIDAAGGGTWENVTEKPDLPDIISNSGFVPVLTNSGYQGVDE
ncbi:MAG: radical SAM protein [Candidatus Thermoplasmatota archaeon]|nr:radical SAM protein [Candidatus Thermoplasmatota archaeon]MCL5962776.1 radical SAM protein [Candidatus Thermoplasmatota archaeon]